MTSDPRPGPVAEGTSFGLPASIARALPYLALFLRLAVGLGLTNIGMASIIATTAPPFGRTPGWPPPSSGPLAGLEPILAALPYLAAAVGVGLVFGIFTTICALAACGLSLVFPLLLTFVVLISGGQAMTPGFNPMMRGLGPELGLVSIAFGIFAAPTLVMLVLLSTPRTNRFSIDALIFTPRPPIAFGVPAGATGPAATPTADPDAPLVPDPLEGWPGPREPSS